MAIYKGLLQLPRQMAPNVGFGLFTALSLFAFREPLSNLVSFSLQYEHYSHVILIPLVTVWLVYLERKSIFGHIQPCLGVGTILFVVALALYYLAQKYSPLVDQNDSLALRILSIVLVWMAGFVLWYGPQAFRAAAFPLAFLLLMVPIPVFLLENAILMLQKGSAEVAYALFRLGGIPVYREGFVFSLPGLNIEVARQCSGIRSSLALVITGLLAGHLFLRSGWRKLSLVSCVLPLLVIKNGLRIVTISLLAIHVDRSFLTGSLHQSGGVLFFLLALAMLVPVLLLLGRSEKAGAIATRPLGVSVEN